MDELILREQIADETAMSRRAFLEATGLLLGFALTGASTESVFAAPASRVVEKRSRVLSRRRDLYGSIQLEQ
jgi:isoquinoline 1-oxidoreductase beta subunit